MTFLENHRIQLDNVVVVQLDMRLSLSAQLNRSSARNTRINEPTNKCNVQMNYRTAVNPERLTIERLGANAEKCTCGPRKSSLCTVYNS